MSGVTVFGGVSLAFMLLSSIWAVVNDRRACDRCVIILSLIAQIAIIAFHALYDPFTTMIAAMCIEGYLAIQVAKSSFPYRSQYLALLFSSITLSFLWGLDFAAGTGLLYIGDEPSIYTYLTAILAVMQGVIFIRTPNGRRGDTDSDRGFYSRFGRGNKGGA